MTTFRIIHIFPALALEKESLIHNCDIRLGNIWDCICGCCVYLSRNSAIFSKAHCENRPSCCSPHPIVISTISCHILKTKRCNTEWKCDISGNYVACIKNKALYTELHLLKTIHKACLQWIVTNYVPLSMDSLQIMHIIYFFFQTMH